MPHRFDCRSTLWSLAAALLALAPSSVALAGGGDTPTNVMVQQDWIAVTVSWTAPSGITADYYQIYRGRPGGLSSIYCETADASTSIRCAMLPEPAPRGGDICAGSWEFKVRAVATGGPQPASDPPVTIDYTGLCASVVDPEGTGGVAGGIFSHLTVVALDAGNEVGFPGFANTTPTVGYNVYRSDVPGGELTRVNSAQLAPTTRRFVDAAAAPGRNYFYQVSAVSASGSELFTPAFSAFAPTPVGEGPDIQSSSWGRVKGLY